MFDTEAFFAFVRLAALSDLTFLDWSQYVSNSSKGGYARSTTYYHIPYNYLIRQMPPHAIDRVRISCSVTSQN